MNETPVEVPTPLLDEFKVWVEHLESQFESHV